MAGTEPVEPVTAVETRPETSPGAVREDKPGKAGEDKPGHMKECSQLGLAEVVAPVIAPDVKYLPASKEHRLWNETEGRWKACEVAEVLPRVGAIVRQVIEANPGDHNEKGVWQESPEAKFALGQLSKRNLADVLTLACGQPVLTARNEDFDTNPRVLLCANGVVNLETGTLIKPTKAMMLSAMCPVAYREDAPATRFLRFMNEILADKADAPTKQEQQTIDYLQKVMGYAACGLTSEHRFWVFWGRRGRNGKTTLLKVIRKVLGRDIAAAASAGTFLSSSDKKAIRSDLAVLQGKRLVVSDEIPPDAELSTTLKSITGGNAITCKLEYGSPFDYTPTFKLILDGNYRPSIRSGDEATWKRIVCVEFPNDFSAKPDRKLDEELLSEKEGVLRWIVEGAVKYFKEGLETPAHVAAAASDHRDEDPMEQFLADCCVVEAGASVPSADLYRAYRTYMIQEEHGHEETRTKDSFSKNLPYPKKKVDDKRCVLGIRLRPEVEARNTTEAKATATAKTEVKVKTATQAKTVAFEHENELF